MGGIGWAFRNDSALTLATDLGWSFSSTAAADVAQTNTAADLFTYTGSPARYSLGLKLAATATPPIDLVAGSNGLGCWSVAYRNAGTTGGSAFLLQTTNQPSNTKIALGMVISGSTNGQPYLVVDDITQYVHSAIDTSVWHYYTLKSDPSTATHSGEMWLDGVQLATATEAALATSGSVFVFNSFADGGIPRPGILGQLAFWSLFADPSEDVKYCTWVDLTEDISETGTWTPDTGTDDFARVTAPFVASSYTENATPSAADRVDMSIGGVGGTDDLADALGVTPGTIYNVSGYCYSTGSGGHSAFAVLGDGTGETDGSAVLIDASNTTGTVIALDNKPSGGAWASTSQPILSYERQ